MAFLVSYGILQFLDIIVSMLFGVFLLSILQNILIFFMVFFVEQLILSAVGVFNTIDYGIIFRFSGTIPGPKVLLVCVQSMLSLLCSRMILYITSGVIVEWFSFCWYGLNAMDRL